MSLLLFPRAVAETYYQLAVAQASSGQIREAETSFHSAIAVLDQRRNNLGKMEHSDNTRGEVADLDALVREIREKMAEHLEKEPSSSESCTESFCVLSIFVMFPPVR